MSNPTEAVKPLSEFHAIGEHVYLVTPKAYTSKEPLILFFSWMGAAPKHIAKYTVAYRKLFPTARLVLVRNELADFFRNEATYSRLLTPAIDVVKQHVDAGGQLLVHSFSNGGGNQLVEFAKAWTKREGSPLPMRAQMIDSAPGNGDWRRSHKAMSTSLPRFWLWRLLGSATIHLFLAMLFVIAKLGRREPIMNIMRRQLNDPALFNRQAPRVYLYSKADEMVGHDEVEEHADQAEAQGWKVTRIRFEKSPHAGHIRENEGRYWGAVQRAWEQGARVE
ncbi:DUF829-domain-containing protein [Paraphaeosphaeria sporulosa]|uniref:DUF829-domain-containing protein n=1 Tax=Paraphaeosphaeria sporulosa TaxID=1460663 RepID=A0A177BVC8_9PLEO|nr:DUF829-domain-containing protein [Paraphaeosphaeria sporulosa]OAF99352.1 DUF829-domain-containing protein [Paraphaeosphaeria sporulosa]